MKTQFAAGVAFVTCLSLGPGHANAGAGGAQTARGTRCAALARTEPPGFSLVITRAEDVGAGPAAQGCGRGAVNLPAHCRVEGMIDRRTGAEEKSYGIGFAVALPDSWNGRFLFQGGGGLNGTVGLPLGAQAAGDVPALVRGFAVVSTDTGHQASGGAFDAAFMRDQQAVLDFEYVAVGRVAVLAKEIVARYYGRPAEHSYFAGCSTGGREAMLMAQRYPTYFDGIIAGAPAMRTGYSGLGDRWVATTLNQTAPKDAAGKPIPARLLPRRQRSLVLRARYRRLLRKDGRRQRRCGQGRGVEPALLVPGMGHCTGGAATLDSFDVLTAMVDWVEKGRGPDAIRATGRSFPGRSRPLCPYPAHAHYKGSGDVEEAASFECRP